MKFLIMASILSSQNVRMEQEPASIAARLGAFAIDAFIVGAIYFTYIIAKIGSSFTTEETMPLLFVILILPLFYPLLCEIFMSGQTLGKRVFHTRVVTLEGGGPKLTALILRWMLLPFDVCFAMGIGELCIFFTKRQQRLGDLAAGTWVVRTQTYDTEDINLHEYEMPRGYEPVYPKAKNLTPRQASLIAEVLENRYNIEMNIPALDLSRKVEKMVGTSTYDNCFDFLDQVLQDYRYEF